jgi:transcriptional regulator with XRE-family HTH domain
MKSDLCERLKSERIQKNLTQQQLADLVNNILSSHFDNDTLINSKINDISDFKVSRVSISRYENGKRDPEIDILYALSEALNVHIGYLLGKSEHKKSDSEIVQNDILRLIKKIDNNKPSSELIRNIIDITYLITNNLANDNSINQLQVIYDLYQNIFDLKHMCLNEELLGLSVTDNSIETLEKLKEKNKILFDKLCESMTTKNK